MHPLVKVGVLVEALPRGFAYVVPIISGESCVYVYVRVYIYIYTDLCFWLSAHESKIRF